MPFIDITDTRVYYEDTGTGESRPRTVLALHSFGTSHEVWRPMRPFLGSDVRLVAPDARGHGRSQHTAHGHSIAHQVRDLVHLIETLELDRPLVVGSSLGAVVATELALARPDLVGAAMIVGGSGHGCVTVPELRDGIAAMAAGLGTDRFATAESAVTGWFGPLVGPSADRWMVRQIMELDNAALAVVDEVLGYDPRRRLGEARVPFTYVHGTLDAIPMFIARECAAATPGSVLIEVDGVAHMPHIEKPGWFADAVTAALEHLSCGPAHA